MADEVTLVGTLLTMAAGVSSGGVAGYLTARFKARQSLEDWRRGQTGVALKAAADLIQGLATNMAAATHSACWLTWRAAYDPGRLTHDDIDRYDYEIHELLPKIFGAVSALGTLSPSAARDLRPAVARITRLDAEIGQACVDHRAGNKSALAACHQQAIDVHNAVEASCVGVGAKLYAAEEIERLQTPARPTTAS